jgi:hypothetical protein
LSGQPKSAEDGSFRALFRAHAAFVWRVLRRHGVREADLEDVCQEVFMVVHRRLGEFEGRSTGAEHRGAGFVLGARRAASSRAFEDAPAARR